MTIEGQQTQKTHLYSLVPFLPCSNLKDKNVDKAVLSILEAAKLVGPLFSSKTILFLIHVSSPSSNLIQLTPAFEVLSKFLDCPDGGCWSLLHSIGSSNSD